MPLLYTDDEEILTKTKEKAHAIISAVQNCDAETFAKIEVRVFTVEDVECGKFMEVGYDNLLLRIQIFNGATDVEIKDSTKSKHGNEVGIETSSDMFNDLWDYVCEAREHYIDLLDEVYPVTEEDLAQMTDPVEDEIIKKLDEIVVPDEADNAEQK